MIISVIEIPNDFSRRGIGKKYTTPKLVCYYIHNRNNFLKIKREVYNINKRTPYEKYEIVGDFSVANEIPVHKSVRIIPGDKGDENYFIVELLKSLEYKIHLIDTICIIKNPDHEEIDILYDRTGSLNVAKRWYEIHKSWMRLKNQAKFEGNPERLKEQGYFNEIEKPGAFKFGKKSNSECSVKRDIRYLKKS
jgi:hypothetical protein